MMFTVYGNNGAFFVSQCVNLVYCFISGTALKYVYMKGEIDDETRSAPHINYVIMGFLDCLSGFLSAMGATNVSGASQQLLNQSIIPFTMFLSYLFLNSHSTYLHIIGAMIIFLGVFIVVLPSFHHHSSSNNTNSLSILIYFSSNIPFAFSYVFKEYGFKNLSVNVIYLTFWVAIYQLFIGFLMFPLQLLPGMGSANGMSISTIISDFYNGFICFLQLNNYCNNNYTFYLLISYCIINFSFNTAGLYLVKHGSATLNSISYAIILPLTTIAFTFKILGKFHESFQKTTLYGLIIILIGFILWKSDSFYYFIPLINEKEIDVNIYNEINDSENDHDNKELSHQDIFIHICRDIQRILKKLNIQKHYHLMKELLLWDFHKESIDYRNNVYKVKSIFEINSMN